MSLCENCRKGQLEMCPYYLEHFLESGAAVKSCPEYEPEVEPEGDGLPLGPIDADD